MTRSLPFAERRTVRIPQAQVAGDEAAITAALVAQRGWVVVDRTVDGSGDVILTVEEGDGLYGD